MSGKHDDTTTITTMPTFTISANVLPAIPRHHQGIKNKSQDDITSIATLSNGKGLGANPIDSSCCNYGANWGKELAEKFDSFFPDGYSMVSMKNLLLLEGAGLQQRKNNMDDDAMVCAITATTNAANATNNNTTTTTTTTTTNTTNTTTTT